MSLGDITSEQASEAADCRCCVLWALLLRGLAPCEAPRGAVSRARPSCVRAARTSAAARARIAHSRCVLRGSPRASRLGSTERRRPVAQRDAVWFSATPAQRIVNRSVAERAWTIVIASSPAGYQRNVERQCPPQCRTSTTTGRPALGTTCAWCARYAFCSVRMATCATDAGHLGSSHWVSERRNLNRFY